MGGRCQATVLTGVGGFSLNLGHSEMQHGNMTGVGKPALPLIPLAICL